MLGICVDLQVCWHCSKNTAKGQWPTQPNAAPIIAPHGPLDPAVAAHLVRQRGSPGCCG